MKRTIQGGRSILTNSGQIRTFASELVSRMMLATKLGTQYDGSRDIYKALGYPAANTLKFEDYLGRYIRQDIAKAVIDRPVNATWQGDLELIETDEAEETPFEKAWRKLNWNLDIKSILVRADRLTGIGRYGVILLGLDDVSNQLGFKEPVKPGKRKLLYLKPFSEKSAKIASYITNPKNKRYGKPLMYEIEVADMSNGVSTSTITVQVHYSRIIHIVDGSLESDVFGSPRLESIYNRLMDLDKIVGGDAEMFWRGARPGFQGVVDKDFTLTPEAEEEFVDQIDEYENYLRRIIVNEGITLKELQQTISDPKNHVDVQLTLISADKGIPKRILSGSERGELSSVQDSDEWKTYVKSRREDFAEPHIMRPLIDRLIELNILPTPTDEYNVDWADLFAISEKERVEIGKARASALREYSYNPMEMAIVPPAGFLQEFLGFSRQQIELMEQMKKSDIMEEIKEMLKLEAEAKASVTPALPEAKMKRTTSTTKE